MNIPLLHRLRAAGGEFVSLDELGADPDRNRRDIDELAAFGFALERHPYRGAAYRGPAERLCPDQIEYELGTERVGRRVAVWNRLGSSNDLAAQAASSTSNEGLAVFAEEQTAGRGRRGNIWIAPARSSLLVSVLLFPPEPLDDPAWLTALGALAVTEVIGARTAQTAKIKWPNDVRVEGRKIAGILVERGLGAVLGIGLNVNLLIHDFPTELRASSTSLRNLTGGPPLDRSELARELLRALDALYREGRNHGPGALSDLWESRSEHLGRAVRVVTMTGEVEGRLKALSLTRGLSLQLASGSECAVALSQVLAVSELLSDA